MRWSHELIRIPPFGRLPVDPIGGLGFVSGNVPMIAFEEGSDLMRLRPGQAVPVKARKVSLCNPFSVAAEVQIIRGPDLVSTGFTDLQDRAVSEAVTSRAAAYIANVASGGPAAGRRRGIGIMARRGRYNVSVSNPMNAAAETTQEIMIIPRASVEFLPLRPAAAFNATVPAYRSDGSIHPEIVCIAGSYTQAEIDAWKAAAGYAETEIRMPNNQGAVGEFVVRPDVALFLTIGEATTFKPVLTITEMGDVSLFTVR